ncbi:thiopeptide-type bacteriocin biosynthesis protein [Kitasatospora sp. NPDC088351]|uniref:thiopeptide-type bacteriocin biosynthesis protein n=1 Tax=unclassified Kitasatospora TaxID=2633591 RepID=UPI0034180515
MRTHPGAGRPAPAPGDHDAPHDGETIRIGEARLTVPQFLRAVAAQLDHADTAADPELRPVAECFLGAGLTALRAAAEPRTWLEYRLVPGPDGATPALYEGLLHTVRELLAARWIDDFFFVHKTPGLRVRFDTCAAYRAQTQDRLARAWEDWRAAGLLTEVRPAVYEPEQHLFGGPRSMRGVHRVFTADSLLWLSHLSLPTPPAPGWALSLAATRVLLERLGVADFEDRDVWDRLRRQLGRRFEAEPPADWPALSARLNLLWHSPQQLAALRAPVIEPAFDAFQESVARACDTWHEEYFGSPGARVGPREAAALLTVFHWNRARMPKNWQVGITEALAQGPSEESQP